VSGEVVISAYELLCLLARKHGWRVRLITNRDLVSKRQRASAGVDGAPTRLLGLEVVYRDDRYVRRALGPGDERLDQAAQEILTTLGLLDVLKRRRAS
jgi:hypothetical protein